MPVSSYFLADAAPAAPAFTRARTGKQNPAEPMVNAAARIGRGPGGQHRPLCNPQQSPTRRGRRKRHLQHLCRPYISVSIHELGTLRRQIRPKWNRWSAPRRLRTYEESGFINYAVSRRSGIPAEQARTLVAEIVTGLVTVSSSGATLNSALDFVIDQKLQFRDSIILSAAAEAGCTLLLSEDMLDGFVIRGVTIVNPLADKLHEKLARLLA